MDQLPNKFIQRTLKRHLRGFIDVEELSARPLRDGAKTKTINMESEMLNSELLNIACELLTELEHHADEEQQEKIEALFNAIKYNDELDEEIDIEWKLIYTYLQRICYLLSLQVLLLVSL